MKQIEELESKLVDIKEMKDTKKLAKWVVLSSMAGMAFNVICEPVISYLYKTYNLQHFYHLFCLKR